MLTLALSSGEEPPGPFTVDLWVWTIGQLITQCIMDLSRNVLDISKSEKWETVSEISVFAQIKPPTSAVFPWSTRRITLLYKEIKLVEQDFPLTNPTHAGYQRMHCLSSVCQEVPEKPNLHNFTKHRSETDRTEITRVLLTLPEN